VFNPTITAGVAQLVVQRTCNAKVGGSSPLSGTNYHLFIILYITYRGLIMYQYAICISYLFSIYLVNFYCKQNVLYKNNIKYNSPG
jgi:hypothetical protein